ncbi:MAG TPA: hypothetical protein VII97_00650 [Anaerolineales bacterium]
MEKTSGNRPTIDKTIDLENMKKWFTDRKAMIKRFQGILENDLPSQILVFYGRGGVGKTTLLNFLQKNYCYKDNKEIPSIYVNLRPDYMHTSAVEIMWFIRSQLNTSNRKFVFPRFDLLFGELWEKVYKLPIKENSTLLPHDAKWLNDLINVVELIPTLGDIGKALNTILPLGGRIKTWLGRESVLKWLAENIEDPYKTNWKTALKYMGIGEFQDLLPKALAADLVDIGEKLKEPGKNILIFIDSYEFLQDLLGSVNGKEAPNFLQSLSCELIKTRTKALIIIAGRNRVRWGEYQSYHMQWVTDQDSIWSVGIECNSNEKYISTYLEQYSLDNFSEEDALEYLHKRGVKDASLAELVFQISRGYPLALSTSVDLIRESTESITNDLKCLRGVLSKYSLLTKEWQDELNSWLLKKLLEQLAHNGKNDLVRLLRAASISRWFNEDLLFDVVGGSNIQENLSHLIQYSFIELHPQKVGFRGKPIYHIHPIIRKMVLDNIRFEAQSKVWNEATLAFFENAAKSSTNDNEKFLCEIESCYQFALYNRKAGLKNLEAFFVRELRSRNLSHCESILQATIDIETWSDYEKAKLLSLQGRLEIGQAQYNLALQRFSSAMDLIGEETDTENLRKELIIYQDEANRLVHKTSGIQ